MPDLSVRLKLAALVVAYAYRWRAERAPAQASR
jgi:hypothetical protein